MAERVVDRLEVVEVDEQNDRTTAALWRGAGVGHTLQEERPVGEAGQRVVIGLVAQLLLQLGQLAE